MRSSCGSCSCTCLLNSCLLLHSTESVAWHALRTLGAFLKAGSAKPCAVPVRQFIYSVLDRAAATCAERRQTYSERWHTIPRASLLDVCNRATRAPVARDRHVPQHLTSTRAQRCAPCNPLHAKQRSSSNLQRAGRLHGSAHAVTDRSLLDDRRLQTHCAVPSSTPPWYHAVPAAAAIAASARAAARQGALCQARPACNASAALKRAPHAPLMALWDNGRGRRMREGLRRASAGPRCAGRRRTSRPDKRPPAPARRAANLLRRGAPPALPAPRRPLTGSGRRRRRAARPTRASARATARPRRPPRRRRGAAGAAPSCAARSPCTAWCGTHRSCTARAASVSRAVQDVT
jgi:hypothetical protein